MKIDGRFWLTKEEKPFLGRGRVELLENIEKTGSIHAAAKEMKMSYKAAWDRIDAMNKLAKQPLLERTVGGKGGGGTTLTPFAKEMMSHYRRLEMLHKKFLDRFGEHAENPDELEKILNRFFVTTSARNQLLGKVEDITSVKAMTTVGIVLQNGLRINSVITSKAAEDLSLEVGSNVYGLIKTNDVVVVLGCVDVQGQNRVSGKFESAEEGEKSVIVTLNLSDGTKITGMYQGGTIKDLENNKENELFAVFDPSHVIVGV